ncbi:HDOD domain-containing protein [Desulfobulbus alkaliphilus]|uniref:HDOD domain-containing protein n=1 Tax=Desulfobulbus alkaliphilus TaxID=869814 RepID=UPI001966995D|nr:HDOD domain-containing protein [Desulfobulbus alkaliphilus]MBM9538237.1 HDOD domain-containing protein [Desulfobulbus alkaliphilus]
MANKHTFVALLKKHIESERLTLPIFDAVSLKIQLELVKKEPNLRVIERLIIADQALSSHLIRIANSVQYQGLVPTKTVKAAIIRIGMLEVARIVSADIHKKKARAHDSQIDAIMKKLWQHSVGCAFAAAFLSRRLDFGIMRDEAFFAALFHDVGKLLILKVIDEIKQKGKAISLNNDLLFNALDKLHAEQGYLLLQRIKMPPLFAAVARDHHLLDYDRNNYILVLVKMANTFCHWLGIGLINDPAIDILKTEEAVRLNLSTTDLTALKEFLETTPGLLSTDRDQVLEAQQSTQSAS